MILERFADAAREGAASPPPARRRVYVIDDDSDVRKSLHFLLASSAIDAWPFAAAADFLDQLTDLSPAPVLLDIRMPEVDGLELLALLRDRGIFWPIIILTAHGDVAVAVRAMKLGAIDFIEKPFQPDLLEQALELAFEKLDRAAQSLLAREDARRLFAQLSPRESEIITILMQGVPNKLVAHRLALSVRTVEMHRGNALAKLQVKSIAEVVALRAAAGSLPEALPGMPGDE